MRYRYIHILAALFLIVGMTVQFVMSYRQARLRVQESIDLKTQIAHEKVLFELYDAYEVIDQMEQYVADNLSEPNSMLKGTSDMLKRYPNIFCLHIDFPPYFYPEKGKWFSSFSYRLNDSIKSTTTGDNQFDYFQREWYKGALKSGDKGYWGKPYWSDVINKTLFTHSDNMVDEQGNLICVVGIDFSLSWLQQLLEQFKPFDEAVCVIYSSDGTVLTASENLTGEDPSLLNENGWILSRQTLETIAIEMVIAVPHMYIWKSILWRVLWSLGVFVLGILVVGVLIRHMLHEQQRNARLETEKEVMSRELQIAHDIQMGILRHDFPQDEDVTMHADLLPMREVGGDLYDFCRRGDFFWFLVGDVSGKGVPAAMFMAATVNLFRSALGHQTSPKAIMEEINAVLSENNPMVTFVTAFIGRLHIPSGQLIYCNAAHMPLLVQGVDGNVRSIKPTPNIPLGYDEKFKFVEQGCLLGKDELLVLYTDGVTEARDVTKQMMGEEQWMDIVAHHADLLEAVMRYIGEAELADDITLMTISKKSEVQPVSQLVPNRQDQWPLLRRTLHDYGVCLDIETRTLKKLEIALEEAVVNIMSYSHATKIELQITTSESGTPNSEFGIRNSELRIVLTDDGVPFDPTKTDSDPSRPFEEREIGGCGISMLQQMVDELHYQRTSEKNQLTIVKTY